MKIRLFVFAAGALLPFHLNQARAQAAAVQSYASSSIQVQVIANPGMKAGAVSPADLRDVFNGSSSTFKGGARVIPVLLRTGPVHDRFLGLYIGKSDSAFRAAWRSLLFSGQGLMPRTLDSETAVVAYVARTPGAVGYIAKTTPHDGVITLTVR